MKKKTPKYPVVTPMTRAQVKAHAAKVAKPEAASAVGLPGLIATRVVVPGKPSSGERRKELKVRDALTPPEIEVRKGDVFALGDPVEIEKLRTGSLEDTLKDYDKTVELPRQEPISGERFGEELEKMAQTDFPSRAELKLTPQDQEAFDGIDRGLIALRDFPEPVRGKKYAETSWSEQIIALAVALAFVAVCYWSCVKP